MAAPLVPQQFPTLSGTEILKAYGVGSNGMPSGQDFLLTTGQIAGLSGFEVVGGGTSVIPSQGNVYKLFSAGTNPASTAADIVVASFTLSANSFDVAGRSLTLMAAGNFANNTNVKTCKIWIGATTAVVGSAITGGTTIATTGAYSTAGAVGWSLSANASKYGAAGSNTQNYQEMSVVIGAAHGGMGVAGTLTLAENAPIICAITINAATTATDASLWQFEINATN